MEDVEQDFSRDIDQTWVVETRPAGGEADLGLTETELDEAAVEQELSGHQAGQTGGLDQVKQAAWRERERGQFSNTAHLWTSHLGMVDWRVLGGHFLSRCPSGLVSYRDSSSGGHRPPPPLRSRPPGEHRPVGCSSPL